MRGIKLTKYRLDKFVFDFQVASLRSCKIFAAVLVRFDYHGRQLFRLCSFVLYCYLVKKLFLRWLLVFSLNYLFEISLKKGRFRDRFLLFTTRPLLLC